MRLRETLLPRRGAAPSRARRAALPLPPPGADVLPDVPIDPRRWTEVLLALLDQHNHAHATKAKTVSHKTQAERRRFLFMFFKGLRQDPERAFRIDPRSLGSRHVAWACRRWVQQGLSAATIQTYLSHLRAFEAWIGKPGLVQPADKYVDPPDRARRTYAAQRDKSWVGAGVRADDVLARVDAIDARVGAQLRLCQAFGLRVREAVMLVPHSCELLGMVEVQRGTKGGRRRLIPIDTDAKRAALAHARQVARGPSAHTGDPALTLKQNYRRFYAVMEAIGVTRRQLGITAHGLRHEYANDRYELHAGVAAPLRGGAPADPDRDEQARLSVMAELGHGRANISTAYLGAILQARRRARAAAPPDRSCSDADGSTTSAAAGLF